MRTFVVATFYNPEYGQHVQCYLRDYHPSWKGFKAYSIEANNGREAKKIAKARRHADVSSEGASRG